MDDHLNVEISGNEASPRRVKMNTVIHRQIVDIIHESGNKGVTLNVCLTSQYL